MRRYTSIGEPLLFTLSFNVICFNCLSLVFFWKFLLMDAYRCKKKNTQFKKRENEMIDFPYSSASEWIVSCRCVVFICMYVNECLDITWRGLYVWLNTSVGGFLVIVAYVQVSFRLWCYRPNMRNLVNFCETKWQIVWMLQAGSILFKCRRVWVWNWMYGGGLVSENLFARPNMSPCHPFRRKKNPNERNWKEFWRKTTERLLKHKLSWLRISYV